MSFHTKAFGSIAIAACVAISAMVLCASDPGYTPLLASLMAPYALLLGVVATLSYGFDLVTGAQ